MSKYNDAYKDQDLPAITFDKVVKVVLPKLTNRDKQKIKQETGVDLMQKFMDAQTAGGSSTIDPAIDKIFKDVSDEARDELNIPKVKAQLNSLVPDDDDSKDPMDMIFEDVDVELEHILFKLSLKHDDKDIDDGTVDKIIADLEITEYIRALMWLIMGRDMGNEEADELAQEVDSKNLDIRSTTDE